MKLTILFTLLLLSVQTMADSFYIISPKDDEGVRANDNLVTIEVGGVNIQKEPMEIIIDNKHIVPADRNGNKFTIFLDRGTHSVKVYAPQMGVISKSTTFHVLQTSIYQRNR